MFDYKNSGIEWIGEIPSNWKIEKIKYISNLYGRIGWQGLTSDEYIDEGPYLVTGVDFSNGKINWNNCVHISEKRWEQADKIQIKNGDLLITKDGTVGKVAIVDELYGKASLNSGVLLIDLNNESSKNYLYWVLCSDVFWTWFNYKNSGNSTILHLYQKDFNEFVYVLPRKVDQKQIANFLDKKCAEIDSIICKIEKQIELLKDYKKSLISETVTKGLDKNVHMKDSGIEWIGKIPGHWEVEKVKNNFEIKSGNGFKDIYQGKEEGDYPFCKVSDISGNFKFLSKSNNYVDQNLVISEKYNLIKPASIIFPKIGEALKKNHRKVNKNICIIDNNCQALEFLKNNNVNYMYYLFIAIDMKWFDNKGTIPSVNNQMLKNFKIPIPGIEEQKQIADYLDKKCEEIDSIISKKEKQLDLIKEHRKSLIYEYVTGKKRIGGMENSD